MSLTGTVPPGSVPGGRAGSTKYKNVPFKGYDGANKLPFPPTTYKFRPFTAPASDTDSFASERVLPRRPGGFLAQGGAVRNPARPTGSIAAAKRNRRPQSAPAPESASAA